MAEVRRILVCGTDDARDDASAVVTALGNNRIFSDYYNISDISDRECLDILFDKGFLPHDLVVLLLGGKYGNVFSDGVSFPQFISQCAADSGVERVVFVKSSGTVDERQKAFLDDLSARLVWSRYRTREQAAKLVVGALRSRAAELLMPQGVIGAINTSVAWDEETGRFVSTSDDSSLRDGSSLTYVLGQLNSFIREHDPKNEDETFALNVQIEDLDEKFVGALAEADSRYSVKNGQASVAPLEFLKRHKFAAPDGRIYDRTFFIFGKTGIGGTPQPCSMSSVVDDEPSERYRDETCATAVCAHIAPCCARLDLVCQQIAKGINKALSGEPDYRFYKQPWFGACLDMLCEEPKSEPCRSYTLAEPFALIGSLSVAGDALKKALEIYHLTHKDQSDDELPLFYRTILKQLVEPNTKLVEIDGVIKREAHFPQDFFFPLDTCGRIVYSNSVFQALRASCETPCRFDEFKDVEIPESDAKLAEALTRGAKGDPDENTKGNFACMTEYARATKSLLDHLKSSESDPLRYLHLANDVKVAEVTLPYLGWYCVPFSRYWDGVSEQVYKDYDVFKLFNETLAALKEAISTVAAATKNAPHAKAAFTLWNELEALLRSRIDDPYGELSLPMQTKFRQKILTLRQQLKAAADELRAADAKASKRRTNKAKKVKPPPKPKKTFTSFRFEIATDYSYIRDIEHVAPDYDIPAYVNINRKAAKNCIKALLKEAGKVGSSGWVKVPPRLKDNWGGAFQDTHPDLYRFKDEQIEVGTKKNKHLGEWRFYTRDDFDVLSPIGKFHERECK